MEFNKSEISNYNLDVRRDRNYQIDIITPAIKYQLTPYGTWFKTVVQSEKITIKPPFTVDISIDTSTLASCNSIKIIINNLKNETRNKLTKDQYSFSEYWSLKVKAGYGDYMMTIFQGNIQKAYSSKQGTEWITEIEGYDGANAIQNGYVSYTAAKNTPIKDIAGTVINSMPNALKGAIGQKGDQTTGNRGFSIMGKSNDVLKTLGFSNTYIYNEKVYLLDHQEYLGDEAIILDSDHLLSSPRRQDTMLECDLMFLPEVKIGYLSDLRSKYTMYNGQYIIQSFKHKFVWSGSSCNEAKTTIGMYCGTTVFQKVAV